MFFLPDNDEHSAISPGMELLQWSNVQHHLLALNRLVKVFESLVDLICLVLLGFGDVVCHEDEWDAKFVESIQCFRRAGYLLMRHHDRSIDVNCEGNIVLILLHMEIMSKLQSDSDLTITSEWIWPFKMIKNSFIIQGRNYILIHLLLINVGIYTQWIEKSMVLKFD